MKKIILFLALMAIFSVYSNAQSDSKGNVGFGFGLDYGGFGTKLTFQPAPAFGLFAGFGYNLATLGYNFGAQYKFPSTTRTTGYLTGMYGYNGVIIVTGAITSSTTYYGPSFGGGIELTSRKREKNFWNLELLFPIRSSEFQRELDALKAIGASVNSPLPFTFSIGYHIRF